MLVKILIVCYSYSGNTYKIACAIRDLTGGTLCVLYPRQPYPMQFQPLLAQVRGEIARGYLPSLLPGLEKAADYDALFVGTPNWCGTIAPPLASYLAGNSLAGKPVFPFYSHCGGGKWNIGADIRRLCPKAIVQTDFNSVNDGGEQLTEKVAQWLRAVGIETPAVKTHRSA